MELEGTVRVIIKAVTPEIEGGRFPVKRVSGDEVVVEADIFADSHDTISAILLYRKDGSRNWVEAPLEITGNDRWRGSFTVTEIGLYYYAITAWLDNFRSWRRDLIKRLEAVEKDISVYLLIGAKYISEASLRAPGGDGQTLREWADILQSDQVAEKDKIKLAVAGEVAALMDKYPDRQSAATYSRQLTVVVDREKARFSAWYEMFPRSTSPDPGKHGTFKDCETRLPYIAEMGFDVLYFPPIHPIGFTDRKGKNNTLIAGPDDPGTPWAIGSKEGGHKSIHPKLGTLEDFHEFVQKARGHGLEIALDIAFQCSPDHPYVKEHPEWFRWRPDGTIQYAENPPKKYQDIYPFNFESEQWQQLWEELKSIILFWIEHGVRIFRIDNPHTKSVRFWEWLISDIKKEFPEVIFLAEAFTRPKMMYQLAESGFSQSYTYFAWRNTKWEITQYITELTQSDVREYFRPNLWPNTPDILTEYLQTGGRPAFIARLVLAATLGASYGIYGPAFELCENRPKELGSEEYLDSEKYEIKNWDIDSSDSLKDFITRVNRIRKENVAFQSDLNLIFVPIDNERLISYIKYTPDYSNIVLVVVNLDPYHTHSGWLELPLETLGLSPSQPYQVHDLLSGARYLWYGSRNFVELNPQIVPVHILRVRRRVRTERDFDYYL